MPFGIEGEVKWSCVGGGNLPLVPGAGSGIEFADGVGHWLGEPDIAAAIDCKEDRTGVMGRLGKNVGWRGTVREALTAVFDDEAGRDCTTDRGWIALGDSDQDVAIIVEGDPPGIRGRYSGFIDGRSGTRICVCVYEDDQGKRDTRNCY